MEVKFQLQVSENKVVIFSSSNLTNPLKFIHWRQPVQPRLRRAAWRSSGHTLVIHLQTPRNVLI